MADSAFLFADYWPVLVYGTVTSVCLAVTFVEGLRAGGGWDPFRLAGLALCFLWPLVVLALIVAMVVGKSGRRRLYRFLKGPSHRRPHADDCGDEIALS